MKILGRRRRLLVDKLQLKLLSINLLYTSAMVLVFVTILFGPPMLTTFDDSQGAEAKLAAADRLLLLHQSTWPAVIVVAALFSFHSILYTHRIAGPLYRFRGVLDKVGQGDLTVRAGIRRKDYLEAESDTINRMIDGIGRRVREIHLAFEEIRAPTNELQSACDGPERRAAMERLEARLEALGFTIEEFQLGHARASTAIAGGVALTETAKQGAAQS